MEYKYFYVAARRYLNKKIGRSMFILDWLDAQRKNGIKEAAWKRAKN
jgi:hypothetical protein